MNPLFGVWMSSVTEPGLILVLTALPALYLQAWADAKVGADLQARIGPNQAGASGVWQPLAAFIRLISKRHQRTENNSSVFWWWVPGVPLAAMLATVPIGSGLPLLRAPMGLLFVVVLALMHSWSAALLSWRMGVLDARFAALRQLSNAVSAAAAALGALLIASDSAGGLAWEKILGSQSLLPYSWTAFSTPFALIAAVIFLLSGMILFGLPPFSPASRPVLWSVVETPGGSGVREAWVRMTRRLAVLAWIFVLVGVFFGGGRISLHTEEQFSNAPLWVELIGALVLTAKGGLLIVLCTIAGRALPAIRADQSGDFVWKVLIPAALLCLAGQRLMLGVFG